jgi:hypothetical protein
MAIKIKSNYKSLKDKKEKKLNIDYKKIEKITEEFLAKYDIDTKIEQFIFEDLEQKLDKNIVFNNIRVLLGKLPEKEYKIVLNYEDFIKYKNFINDLLNKYIEIEKEKLNDDEKEIFEKIIDNFFDEIDLTMFENGIHRLTLVTFHYYLKVLETFATMYMTEFGVTNIKRAKNPLEIFLKDLYTIISKDEELTRFLLTLKSLIEQWLTKYNSKTKISEFYYDILMITPEHITERILKYLLFTAIKNKNPLTLRAIFSSYITLIHQNIFSFFATNLSKVKVGYFKQLENLFTENFSLIFENNLNLSSGKFILDIFMITFLTKNKRFIKKDYFIFEDEFFQHFFEANYFDMIYSYPGNIKINLIDYSYGYNKFLKFTINCQKDICKYYKINHEFFKNNNKKKYFVFVKDKLINTVYPALYELIHDKETCESIIDLMARDIVQKLNFQYLLDENYNLGKIDQNYYLKELDTFVEELAKKTILNIKEQ